MDPIETENAYCAFVFEDDEEIPVSIGSYPTEKEACQAVLAHAIDGPFDYARFVDDSYPFLDTLDDFYNLDDAIYDRESLGSYMQDYAPGMRYLVLVEE